MKKIFICFMIAAIMLCCMPMAALAEDDGAVPSPSPDSLMLSTPAPAASDTPEPTATPDTTDPPEPIQSPGQLSIDSKSLYPGMTKTYENGYVPVVKDGTVTIILPLIGKTQTGEVTLTADLGATTDSPFVFGNYAQTAKAGEPYVFTLSIPLSKGHINGVYPVTFTASYLDANGALAGQTFIVYVTITDGKTPVDPNAVQTPEKLTVDKPELFISSCEITPSSVGGNEEFEVKLTVENIGTLRARSVRLTYGGAAAGGEAGAGAATIVPIDTNNSIHLENIAAGKSDSASFKLKTTKDVLAGNQSFTVTLDYTDAYGGVYTSVRQFLIAVTQPAEISYDPITPPKTIAAGETFTLPANVFNIGKSTLRNVSITVTGAGLFPTSSVFLGDIAPGGTGNGEISVFAGQLSMTEGYTETYGTTNGKYIITYTEDTGETKTIELDFSMEITEPVIEGEEEDSELTEEPAFQWWVTILVGFAIIAIIVAVIVVARFIRAEKMK